MCKMCASSLQKFLNAERNSVGGYYKYDNCVAALEHNLVKKTT